MQTKAVAQKKGRVTKRDLTRVVDDGGRVGEQREVKPASLI